MLLKGDGIVPPTELQLGDEGMRLANLLGALQPAATISQREDLASAVRPNGLDPRVGEGGERLAIDLQSVDRRTPSSKMPSRAGPASVSITCSLPC